MHVDCALNAPQSSTFLVLVGLAAFNCLFRRRRHTPTLHFMKAIVALGYLGMKKILKPILAPVPHNIYGCQALNSLVNPFNTLLHVTRDRITLAIECETSFGCHVIEQGQRLLLVFI